MKLIELPVVRIVQCVPRKFQLISVAFYKPLKTEKKRTTKSSYTEHGCLTYPAGKLILIGLFWQTTIWGQKRSSLLSKS